MAWKMREYQNSVEFRLNASCSFYTLLTDVERMRIIGH
jgi:hypothetical protein